jgi:hypothetical protein
MTAPRARQPRVLPRPACTPTAIRAVLAVNADGDIVQRYDEDLDVVSMPLRSLHFGPDGGGLVTFLGVHCPVAADAQPPSVR